jgi:hypothetical protein
LLVTRGILLYGENPRAVHDFESAIQAGSAVICPYFFLAHLSLLGGQLERCRTLAERALEREGSDAIQSELAEWLAIAQSGLGYPAELVRESFDRAIRSDPTNERARRNLSAYEAAAQPIPAGSDQIRDRSAIRISGRSERRSRPAARPGGSGPPPRSRRRPPLVARRARPARPIEPTGTGRATGGSPGRGRGGPGPAVGVGPEGDGRDGPGSGGPAPGESCVPSGGDRVESVMASGSVLARGEEARSAVTMERSCAALHGPE